MRTILKPRSPLKNPPKIYSFGVLKQVVVTGFVELGSHSVQASEASLASLVVSVQKLGLATHEAG